MHLVWKKNISYILRKEKKSSKCYYYLRNRNMKKDKVKTENIYNN